VKRLADLHDDGLVGDFVQIHAPDRLRRGQVDEYVHATEQITLEQALLGRAEHGEVQGISRVEVHPRRQYPSRDIGRTTDDDAIDDKPGLGGHGPCGHTDHDQAGEAELNTGHMSVPFGEDRNRLQPRRHPRLTGKRRKDDASTAAICRNDRPSTSF
jgi:hypothetical protein